MSSSGAPESRRIFAAVPACEGGLTRTVPYRISLEGTTVMPLVRVLGLALKFGAYWLSITTTDNVGRRREARGSIR